MKYAKIMADNKDEIAVEATVNGTVLVTTIRDSLPLAFVELDEATVIALCDVLTEARRSALQAASRIGALS